MCRHVAPSGGGGEKRGGVSILAAMRAKTQKKKGERKGGREASVPSFGGKKRSLGYLKFLEKETKRGERNALEGTGIS